MAGYNLPDGVTGGEDYFNPPDEPECPKCYGSVDWEYLYCPWCGEQLRKEQWDGDVYLGDQLYDCRRDYDVDRALDAHDYSEYEPDDEETEDGHDWYAEEGERAYRAANGW